MSFGMTLFLSVWGEGSSGDSIHFIGVINVQVNRRCFLPPCPPLKPGVIPNSSTQKYFIQVKSDLWKNEGSPGVKPVFNNGSLVTSRSIF
jgi:hypothetical protein